MRQGIIPTNPVDAIKPLSKDAKSRGILSTEEVKQLLTLEGCEKLWPSSQVFLVNLLAGTTGMRMGEIQALRWGDIQPAIRPDRIIVRHSWDRRFGLKTTKTKKERVIPMSVALRSRLFYYLKRKGDEDFVFTNIEGKDPIHETGLLISFYVGRGC
jgi:integrase